ncbi:MAG: CRISPR-associated endonuclease Cas2 [Firmicutes bacterium]|nr:CRISPR-associated endonuclease Cas2 [Bacillota bacterium]
MQILVIYDIPNDRLRNKVVEVCKDLGLFRIQYSAFTGNITSARRTELFRRLEAVLGREPGNIQMYPICEKDLEQKAEIINV